jgi:hypothetical protein
VTMTLENGDSPARRFEQEAWGGASIRAVRSVDPAAAPFSGRCGVASGARLPDAPESTRCAAVERRAASRPAPPSAPARFLAPSAPPAWSPAPRLLAIQLNLR